MREELDTGEGRHGKRPGRPPQLILPGADRCVGVIDRERGVLLRCEAWFGGELLMVEELAEVVFDEPLNLALFLPS